MVGEKICNFLLMPLVGIFETSPENLQFRLLEVCEIICHVCALASC